MREGGAVNCVSRRVCVCVFVSLRLWCKTSSDEGGRTGEGEGEGTHAALDKAEARLG